MVKDLTFKIKTLEFAEIRWRLSVAALTLFSGLTNLWGLANVERSEYYAAIANSMSKNFSNFLFGAMDPAGIVTLDKIPGSFWIPAVSVKVFGFSTWSITVPNALAAIAATLVITFVVKKYYGMTAGLIAGSILATTPIVVAVARSNQPQTFYYLAIAVAIRFALMALNELSRKHLIWAGIWIAVAFHSYMLLSWAIWPPLILGYLLTNQALLKKIKDLLIAGSISLFTSGIWILLVALTSAQNRPYIGGTNSNSALELVTGYNGLGRFTKKYVSGSQIESRTFTPPFGGEPGPFRLFNANLISQISWLLPAAIVSIALLIFLKHKSPTFIFVTAYLIIQTIVFSAVLGMHQFYVSTMAIPIAIIVAIGIREFRAARRPLLIISTLMVASIWALNITLYFRFYFFPAAIFQVAMLAVFLLISYKVRNRVPETLTSALFILALVFTPAIWSIDTLDRSDAINPIAGPKLSELRVPNGHKVKSKAAGTVSKRAAAKLIRQDNIELIEYIRRNSDSKFALATFTSLTAAPYINTTDDLIYPIGGFNGDDPYPSLLNFQSIVKNGEIRYVLTTKRSENRNNSDSEVSNRELIKAWVDENCSLDAYEVSGYQLRDCK
jgi:4-amino-4-deoxy-L-arabinose transferase-like glycosyltransferase